MKDFQKRVLSMLLVLCMALGMLPGITLTAEAHSDNGGYPYNAAAAVYIADEWGFYQCECTSFAAYCLNTRNGFAFRNTMYGSDYANKWGNANHWGEVARQHGISVDGNPRVGDVAWDSSGATGHVAWVCEVNGDTITIDEYNYGYDGTIWDPVENFLHGNHRYNTRTVSKDAFQYIHFPMNGSSDPTPTIIDSGSCGKNGDKVTWTLDKDGTLTIRGTGEMEDHASVRWRDIKTVVIENGVTSIGIGAFYLCRSLTSITIPNSVTSIGAAAFSSCTNLSSATIPNSVTSIGGSAFVGCENLSSVTIPSSVTSIEDYTFSGCSNLSSVTIPDSITSIGTDAFSDCTSLSSVTIPNSIISMGYGAFRCCTNLSSVTISNGVTSIGAGAFEYCTNLSSVTIPNSVTSIGRSAFVGCESLSNVTIPNGVTSIEGHVFYGCSNLSSVTIPDSVTSIGDSAFGFCSMTNVIIPNGVTSIGKDAFWYCSNLASITIPTSVTSIGYSIFGGCGNLTDIYYTGSKSQLESIEHDFPWYATIHYNSTGPATTPGDKGDVTGDGDISIGDVVKLARAVAGYINLTAQERMRADVTGDGDITIGDVVKLTRYVAGYITDL